MPVAAVAADLLALVERTVEGLGYELVDVERAAGGLLRVTLDTEADAGITIEDCERVSHQLTHMFAVENVAYERLEVGSPGVDRPLKKPRDYVRFMGEEVKVQLFAPLNGRKRWQGRLLAVTGESGAERLTLAVTPDEEAAEPVRRVRAVALKASGKTRGKAGAKTPAEPQTIEFALADVDKARLVPMLDFRSKQ
jgi:ribosome maturation factor RimP